LKKNKKNTVEAAAQSPKGAFVNPRKISHGVILLCFLAAITCLNLFWFVSGGEPLHEESAFRFVIGSLLIFVIPGMIWGELLRFKSDHFYTTIAKSFLLTLAAAMLLIPVPFIFAATIKLWVWLMLAVTVTGLAFLFYRLKKDESLVFLSPLTDIFSKPLKDNLLLFIQLFFIALITFGAYRWGEDIGSVSGEKILHMTFLRYYFSMPMSLYDLSLTKGAPPPNLVNLWEYLVAGWSMLINIDPLYLFNRCRFVIPLLGLSGMYLFVNGIFPERKKSDTVFSGVLLMCLGAFVLLSPSPYDWLKGEQFRGVFSFIGTAHHADSATDILVALSAGALFIAVREPSWRNILLLCTALIASFLWHPREFFQTAVYAGILGLTILLTPSEGRFKKLKKWILIMAVFFLIAAAFFVLMKLLIPPQSHGYNEFKIKETVVKYAFQFEHITGIRNLFHFPSMFTVSSTFDPNSFLSSHSMYERSVREWNYMPFLMLSAAAMPVLVLYGGRSSRRLALFTFLLWFFALGWNFSMLMLIALTYSEIHMTTIRILYLFSYAVIADALYLLAVRFYKPEQNLYKYPAVLFAAGLAIAVWWYFKAPLAHYLTYPLTAAAWFSAVAVIFDFRFKEKEPSDSSVKTLFYAGAVISMAAFFVPLSAKDYMKLSGDIASAQRQAVDWHGQNNPFELSPSLLAFLKGLEPKNTFAMDLNGKACIFVYHPQYAAVAPKVIGTIISANEEQDAASFGMNPIFNPQSAYGVRQPLIREISGLKPVFEDSFLNWKGPDTVHWQNLSKVASPLMVLSAGYENPNFAISRISGSNLASIRLSYEKSENTVFNSEWIMPGYYMKKRVADINSSGFVTFTLSARTNGSLSKPARLVVFDEASVRGIQDKEAASVEIAGGEWHDYIVTKKIRDNNSALGAAVHWLITDKEGWVEIKKPKIYVYNTASPVGQTINSAGIDEIIDHGKAVAWLKKYKADYVLVNRTHYDTLKRFFDRYSTEFQIVFDDPRTKDMVVKYKGGA
jgi:hypothetical protein